MRRGLAFGFWLGITMVVAAAPDGVAQNAPRWLVGLDVVDGRSGETVRTIGGFEKPRSDNQYWLGSEQYSCGTAVVDLARDEFVDYRLGWFGLRGFDGKARWAIRSLATFDPHCCPVLARDHVVYVTRDGKLRALKRETGQLAWEVQDAPAGLLTVESDLVVVADRLVPRKLGRRVELAAYSLANGRLAFRAPLPAPAQRVVVTDAGIAVMGAKYAVVHDRFGPQILQVDGETLDVRGGKAGWFVLRSERIDAFDRAGEPLWSIDRKPGIMRSAALEVLPDGGLLIWRRDLNVDRGVGLVCRSPINGELRWNTTISPAGKFRPPYRQGRVEVRANDRGIHVLSVTSTGAFVAQVSAKTGAEKKRVALGEKRVAGR